MSVSSVCRLCLQKQKSNPYGRLDDAYDSSDTLFNEPLSTPSNSQYQKTSKWLESNDDDDLDDSITSHVENLFPLSEPKTEENRSHNYQESVSLELESKASWASSSQVEEIIDAGPPILPNYEDAEEQFLEEYEDYFEHLAVDNVRKEQYPKLELQRIVYLDYANFSLYSQYQVEQHMRVLLEEGPCLGSAALSNSSAIHLRNHVSEVQEQLLRLFNTSKNEYAIIFTTGFAAGFRLFGEAYPFQKNQTLLLCQDNHEAVKHVASSASKQGTRPIITAVRESDLCIESGELRKQLLKQTWQGGGRGVYIYPAQSCLSGVRHSLNWIAEAQQNGWHVLIDVSTYLPTGSLNLSIYQPEFVLGSLHHMLGYPSGMGYLLVKRQIFSIQRTRFTDSLKLVLNRSMSEGGDCHIVCEDDSISLLSFAALEFGLEHLEMVGLERVQKRVTCLLAWLVQVLRHLRHKVDESKPLVQVYGSLSTKNRGNIVTFNLVDSTGQVFPPTIVQRMAEKSNIIVSAGYFGNPGLAYMLGKPLEKVLDLTIFNQPPNFSAVRLSLGLISTFQDVYRFAQFLSLFRDEEYLSGEAMDFIEESK
ncbi:hypothetical protein O6H91_04G147100 [Diphasiastrum complanatum]|uniref:Uncharacterized protein n=1 Tax=Diphasiastrum complanatum TaxID=34168 RepID=A0ACC2E2J1_DIPCM|nr:hypothetical protein O6H91_04G147100 [Diphasiastrum complanatum]